MHRVSNDDARVDGCFFRNAHLEDRDGVVGRDGPLDDGGRREFRSQVDLTALQRTGDAQVAHRVDPVDLIHVAASSLESLEGVRHRGRRTGLYQVT
ncbi:MAG: hypothetical protein ACJ8CB_30760 [Ktedonobacteraceae bacterium]